jgi:thiol-disulfide isomerase/thioredoxin
MSEQETGETGHLETMDPSPTFDEAAFAEAIAVFAAAAEDVTVRVWGGDWCGDCRAVLPEFGAALEAAGVPEERVLTYPTEKREDGSKVGPLVEAYGVEYIPTVVVELDGEEVARFVESEPVAPVVHLAEQLESADVTA